MPRAPSRTSEARRAAQGALALGVGLWLACAAPDGEDLYAPLAGGSGGASAGAAGVGGNAGTAAGSAGTAGTAGAGAGGQSGGAGSGGSAGLGGGGLGGAGSAGAGAGGSAEPVDAGAGQDSGVSACAPLPEVCNGLDDDCDGVADPAGTCPAGCQGFALETRVYMFCAEALPRATALGRCTAVQMNLTWIETPEENAALVQALTGLGVATDGELLVQIGASDAEGEEDWFWVANAFVPNGFQFWVGAGADDGGEPVDDAYQNWGAGEPNDDNDGEDCAIMSVLGDADRDAGQWDDRSCDTALAFVCEAP